MWQWQRAFGLCLVCGELWGFYLARRGLWGFYLANHQNLSSHDSHLCLIWLISMAYLCSFCGKSFVTYRGQSAHIKLKHRNRFSAEERESFSSSFSVESHCGLNGRLPAFKSHMWYLFDFSISLAVPCDKDGNPIRPGSAPPPRYPVDATPSNPWHPFPDRIAFEFADIHFTEQKSSKSQVDRALDFWLASTIAAGGDGHNVPWKTAKEMHETIDSIKAGPVPWKTVRFRYTGTLPPGTPPKWMCESYDLCFRDPHLILLEQITLPDLHDHFDYVPYMQFNEKGDRIWSNLMSGAWAWQEAVRLFIYKLPQTDSDVYRMIFFMIIQILVERCLSQLWLVATKQLYLLQLVIRNSIQYTLGLATWIMWHDGRIHLVCNRSRCFRFLKVSSFLQYPQTFVDENHLASRKHRKKIGYQTFCRQLYHACLAHVFSSLKPSMTTPEVVRCPDGHFRHAVFSLGPYIADYPEQVWLTGIVQHWCGTCVALFSHHKLHSSSYHPAQMWGHSWESRREGEFTFSWEDEVPHRKFWFWHHLG